MSPTKLKTTPEPPYANRKAVIKRPSFAGLKPVPIASLKSWLVNRTAMLMRSKKPAMTTRSKTPATPHRQRAPGWEKSDTLSDRDICFFTNRLAAKTYVIQARRAVHYQWAALSDATGHQRKSRAFIR